MEKVHIPKVEVLQGNIHWDAIIFKGTGMYDEDYGGDRTDADYADAERRQELDVDSYIEEQAFESDDLREGSYIF